MGDIVIMPASVVDPSSPSPKGLDPVSGSIWLSMIGAHACCECPFALANLQAMTAMTSSLPNKLPGLYLYSTHRHSLHQFPLFHHHQTITSSFLSSFYLVPSVCLLDISAE